MSRLHLWSFPCAFCAQCAAQGGRGCQPAPGLPCALRSSRGRKLTHNSGDSRRENAPAHPRRCLTIESELARLGPPAQRRQAVHRQRSGAPALRVYSRAGMLIKLPCGNLVGALCYLRGSLARHQAPACLAPSTAIAPAVPNGGGFAFRVRSSAARRAAATRTSARIVHLLYFGVGRFNRCHQFQDRFRQQVGSFLGVLRSLGAKRIIFG